MSGINQLQREKDVVELLTQYIHNLGTNRCVRLDSNRLVLRTGVRDACKSNRCGQHGMNYMCPPHIGSVSEILERRSRFQKGGLFQKEYSSMKAGWH
jgi:predicted metal-binding protein